MLELDDDSRGSALRPVNCPGHVQIYQQELRSYRDLPLRLAEFGVVHRKEPSGALQGLFRLREFTRDDGHVFCRPDQLLPELSRFCGSLQAFYRRFGFDELIVGLSTRPPARIGDEASWDRAEAAPASAASELGLPVLDQPGEGAFYGPKLEFKLRDRLGRVWQCGTIQVDFAMPERFELAYAASDGERRRPVMLHRALYGSGERFIGVLLEHHSGKLPAWLAPEQAYVLPVSAAEAQYAAELARALRQKQVRLVLTDAGERLASRVAEARRAGAVFVLVVGPRAREPRGERQPGGRDGAGRVRRRRRTREPSRTARWRCLTPRTGRDRSPPKRCVRRAPRGLGLDETRPARVPGDAPDDFLCPAQAQESSGDLARMEKRPLHSDGTHRGPRFV